MNIAGLQKMTLLDYPGKVACTVFLQGCNFRCPFCHNSGLLGRQEAPIMNMEQFLTFLQRRQGLLDAVCVSGGEPTLAPDLKELLIGIKALGFHVKLDTNGSRPEILEQLVREGLVDYVAMDIKNSPACYGETAGIPAMDLQPLERSIRFLVSGAVDHEFRTTVVAEYHDEKAMENMGIWLKALSSGKKIHRIFLQPFQDRDSVLLPGLHAPSQEQLDSFCKILAPYADTVQVRGTN